MGGRRPVATLTSESDDDAVIDESWRPNKMSHRSRQAKLRWSIVLPTRS